MNKLTFATKKDALEFLRGKDALEESSKTPGLFFPTGTYYLSHGEYSKPDYTARRYKDGWGIHVTYYYYGNTLFPAEDGRIEFDVWARMEQCGA